MEYENMRLWFADSETPQDRLTTYQQLLDNFQKRGNYSGFENLSKEFQEYKYTSNGSITGEIANFIDWFWWDYGYNKFWVIRSALILNFIFFIINLFIFRNY